MRGWTRRNGKYNAVKVRLDGYTFDSKLEARYYGELMLREQAGEIRIERVHPRYPIEIRGKKVCTVELDFIYLDLKTLKSHFIDCKGVDLPMSKLKRRLVEAEYSLKVELVTK